MITYYAYDEKSKIIRESPEYRPGVWVHVENPTDEEKTFLVETLRLDKGHIHDALDEDENPRFEVEGSIVYVFTRFPHVKDDSTSTLPFLIVITEKDVITISLVSPRFFNPITLGKFVVTTSFQESVTLFMLTEITKLYSVSLTRISKEIRKIRRSIEKIKNRDIVQFVAFEEILNDFKPSLAGTDNVVRHLASSRFLQLTKHDTERFEDIHLSNKQIIDNCSDTLDIIRNVRGAYTTILTNNLNNVIKFFTSMTVILTIPTIVASLYGMNVSLPFAEHPMAFFGIVTLTIGVVTVSLYIFLKRDWL